MVFGSKKKKPDEEEFSCEMYSRKFFLLCAAGGVVACGLTHLFVTPLDTVKCRLQSDPRKYKSIVNGFKVSVREGGIRSIFKGWAPTLFGYSCQGAAKFGGYEYFKWNYASMFSEENAYLYRTWIYLLASASAEFCADIFLAPFEATKVRMQTLPRYPSQMRIVMPCIYRTEGLGAFFRVLPPLWGRQIPYTMMKFASFEKTVEYLYASFVPKPREQCTKSEQLMVTFLAGYIAGVFCAVVSHPADTMVSKMQKDPTATVGSIFSQLGFRGLWGGLGLRIIMVGTLTGLQWFIYDGFKVFTKMPRPPPAVPPPALKKRLEEEEKLRKKKEAEEAKKKKKK